MVWDRDEGRRSYGWVSKKVERKESQSGQGGRWRNVQRVRRVIEILADDEV